MTTPDALRDALAEALHGERGEDIVVHPMVAARSAADAVLAHPAVLAALDRSDPDAEAIEERYARIRVLQDEYDRVDRSDPAVGLDWKALYNDLAPLVGDRDSALAAILIRYRNGVRSDPAVGLREAVERLTVYRYILPTDDESTPTRTHRPFDMVKRNDVLAALAATPTASPTAGAHAPTCAKTIAWDDAGSGPDCTCGAASPTATGADPYDSDDADTFGAA